MQLGKIKLQLPERRRYIRVIIGGESGIYKSSNLVWGHCIHFRIDAIEKGCCVLCVSGFNSSNPKSTSQTESTTYNSLFTRFISRETVVVISFPEESERERKRGREREKEGREGWEKKREEEEEKERGMERERERLTKYLIRHKTKIWNYPMRIKETTIRIKTSFVTNPHTVACIVNCNPIGYFMIKITFTIMETNTTWFFWWVPISRIFLLTFTRVTILQSDNMTLYFNAIFFKQQGSLCTKPESHSR